MCCGLRTPPTQPPNKKGSCLCVLSFLKARTLLPRSQGPAGGHPDLRLPVCPGTELGGQRPKASLLSGASWAEQRPVRPVSPALGPSHQPGKRCPGTAHSWIPLNSSHRGQWRFYSRGFFNAFKYMLRCSCQKDVALLKPRQPLRAEAEQLRCPGSQPPTPTAPPGRPRGAALLLPVLPAPNLVGTVASAAATSCPHPSPPAGWEVFGQAARCLSSETLMWPVRAQTRRPDHRGQAPLGLWVKLGPHL